MRRMMGALVVAMLGMTGCGSSSGTGSPSAPPPTKSSATITGNFENTTCAQWLHDFTKDQQIADAEEFAQILHATDQSHAFAKSFAADISTDCQAGPTLKLKEVVAALATLDSSDFPR